MRTVSQPDGPKPVLMSQEAVSDWFFIIDGKVDIFLFYNN